MPPSRPMLALDKRTADAVRRGHPWVYGDQLPRDHRLQPGSEVDLQDPRGAFLGRALVDPHSPIPLRVWSRDPGTPPLAEALAARIGAARRLRERTVDLGRVTGYRLVHGEGDDLPGLVVDRYAEVLVVRTYFGAWEPLLPRLLEALRAEGGEGISGIVRAGVADRHRAEEEVDATATALWGKPPPRVEVIEGDRRYSVRPGMGQKTGFFLDQRPNRDAVEAFVRPGDRALNLFGFTGGFSVALARAGARSVTTVDIARGALVDAEGNLERNGIDSAPHEFVAQDAFAFLQEAARDRPRYSLVVSDPPAFARKAAQVPEAKKAYRNLHRLLGAVVAPGGMLVTASCTARITEEDLAEEARVGLAMAGRRFRVVARGGAGPDHPVPLGFPEGRYLKVLYGVVGE